MFPELVVFGMLALAVLLDVQHVGNKATCDDSYLQSLNVIYLFISILNLSQR